jgi:phosphoribosylformylglycinamidine synthase subunit PurQ / glutaminase
MTTRPGQGPPVLVMHVTGTNRDGEAAWACALAGGSPEIVHLNQLLNGERRLKDYRMLVLPGGFSYGDDLGAGKLWALALRYRLGADLQAFIAAGRPVLGICNGFQALVKAGLLPDPGTDGAESVLILSQAKAAGETEHKDPGGTSVQPQARPVVPWQTVTLAPNALGSFECRWVFLQAEPNSPCVFTAGIIDPIHCPVAHGEGRFVVRDGDTLANLEARNLVALRYVAPPGHELGYPWNPNGSQAAIAGICSPSGTVLGLMPHPEDHILPGQDPRGTRAGAGGMGLPLFRNGIRYAGEL